MKSFLKSKIRIFLEIVLVTVTLICTAYGFDTTHEIRKVASNHRGYQEAWIRITNPDQKPDSRERPLEVTLPLCNKKSVKKLDQYCAAPDGTVAQVTAIRGEIVSYEAVDLSTSVHFAQFANAIRPSYLSRMPASAPEPTVVCEASCPQMDFTNPCKGSGSTKEKAFSDLQSAFTEKQTAECKNCTLRTVVCDGSVFKIELEN